MPGGQPTDVCGIEADYHEGPLYRVVLGLQPTLGAGMPFHFSKPLWEEEATVCAYHLYPPEYEAPPDPLPEGWESPEYRAGPVSLEGHSVRLVWEGEIVE